MTHRLLGILLMGSALAACVTRPAAPPPAPPPPPPSQPPRIRIGTPLQMVTTPELQALVAEKTDQQMLIEFVVQADGQVQNPKALFTGLSPADTKTALQSFQQWRFKPALDAHQPVARQFIYPLFFGPDARQDRTRFFCRNQAEVYDPDSKCEIVTFGRWRIYRMDPVYPANLLSQHLAGAVTLSFDIGAQGQVLDPKVESATPPELFDAAALAAVKQWYFEPLEDPQKNTAPEHVTVTVKFTPPEVPATSRPSSPLSRH